MKTISLEFTPAELRGLRAIADEGAEGLLTDPESAKSYIGNKTAQAAAESALKKVKQACAAIQPKQKASK